MDDDRIANHTRPDKEPERRNRLMDFRPIGSFRPRQENRAIAWVILFLLLAAGLSILHSM